MFKKILNSRASIFFTAIFLLLPLANLRVFSNFPIYYLDAVLLLTLATLLFDITFSIRDFLRDKKIIFLGVFLVSVTVSALVTNPSPTTFGFLKSWFILPIITLSLFVYSQRNKRDLFQDFTKAWGLGLLFLLALSGFFASTGGYTFDGRLVGSFISPNFLGYLLFPGALLAWRFYTQEKGNPRAFFWLLAIPGFLSALILTQSLGSLLALLGASIAYTAPSLTKKFLVTKRGLSALATLFIFSSLFFVFNQNWVTSLSGERSSLSSRVIIWQSAWHIAKDAPVFGVGIGNFQSVYLDYQSLFPPYLEWAVPQPHNLFLALWLQAGLAGVMMFGYMTFLIAKSLSKVSSYSPQSLLGALLFGSLIYGLFDTPLFGNALAAVWWSNFLLLYLINKDQD